MAATKIYSSNEHGWNGSLPSETKDKGHDLSKRFLATSSASFANRRARSVADTTGRACVGLSASLVDAPRYRRWIKLSSFLELILLSESTESSITYEENDDSRKMEFMLRLGKGEIAHAIGRESISLGSHKYADAYGSVVLCTAM